MKLKIFTLIFLIISIPQVQSADVETFVSPDCSYSSLQDFLTEARNSLLIASYTFNSPEIMDMLIEKEKTGVHVELLIEKSPAGGMPETEEAVLCSLAENNISVMLYDGPLRYMHAKYIIRDDEASLVTSENLGPAGFSPGGDYGNRGWGAVVHDLEISLKLKKIYEEDKSNSTKFVCKLENYTVEGWNPAGAYVPKFKKEFFRNQDVELIFSPDSLNPLLSLINSANSTILVDEFYIYPHWGSAKYGTIESAPNPLLEALIEKARAGVRVLILLDNAYYSMDEETGVNYQTIEYVNSVAANESIPIQAKAMDLDKSGLARLHNKGIIIDKRIVLVSSINWNENSVMRNREAGLIITGESAEYYSDAFGHDSGEAAEEYGLGFFPAMVSLAALIIVIIFFYVRKTSRSFSKF
jgi:phosphatidylserine/phosphatidylglycerophosphate/cardiolipin synthase-like enzyme